MNRQELIHQIKSKKSLLCVGLDTDIEKLPKHLGRDLSAITEFNKSIIEATKDYAVAYKINTAFYEQYGSKGWDLMEETLAYIPSNCFTIADAKRGDIGNTSAMYAKAFFETLNYHSITVAPYMGEDSLSPFYSFKDKWVICLGLTSNKGSKDFQVLETGSEKLYQTVMKKVAQWGTPENTMFVVGATKSEQMKAIRDAFPEHFLLVPGVGAQGGNLEEVCQNACTKDGGLLINSSRGILYASNGTDYAERASEEARKMQEKMKAFL